MLRRALPFFALLLPACADEAGRVIEAPLAVVPPARDPGVLRATMLDAHNAARAAVGVPPLRWDQRLAEHAAAYADQMARTGRWAHADQPPGPNREGENLWMGTRGAYRYEEMAGHWLAERRDYVPAPVPQVSRTGRWQDVGHYTQMVWRGTTAIGCAMAASARSEYLVCRYAPAGNVVGQRAF